MVLYKVRMTIPPDHPGVHDGAGGEHRAGETPLLDAHVAAVFVKKGFGLYVDGWPVRKAHAVLAGWRGLEYREKLATVATLGVAVLGAALKVLMG